MCIRICFFLLFSSLYAAFPSMQPPKITLSIPQESAVEGRDIPLYITIVHGQKDRVDETSFLMEETPYKVSVIQKEKIAPQALFREEDEDGIEVSRYRGMLPAKKPGIYTIGPISVLVNDVRYESGAISLSVQGAVVSKVLRLEVKPLLEKKIFPGQEVSFEYKIYYEKPIQLTREDLPLLKMNGFLQVGSPQLLTEETSEGGVQTITQRARAEQPGTFSVKESSIEGFEIDTSDPEKRLIPPLYRSSVPGMELKVLPFPKEGAPPDFDGTIGSFAWRVSSLDGTKINLGEPVRIEYRVSGRGELSSVKFPLFTQIVGLQDSFWTESIPPVGEETDGTKRFILTLRPKRTGRVDVPGFFVYSFDPVSERYNAVSVSPFSLKVDGQKENEIEVQERVPVLGRVFQPPYELTQENVQEIPMVIVGFIIGALFLIGIGEVFLKKKIHVRRESVTSKKLFYEAIKNRSKGYAALKVLREAFYRRLYEVGLTAKIEETLDSLPNEGLGGEVKGYLKSLDEALYGRGIPSKGFSVFFDEAIGLYQKLKQLPEREKK